jgi:hypothetical protein
MNGKMTLKAFQWKEIIFLGVTENETAEHRSLTT